MNLFKKLFSKKINKETEQTATVRVKAQKVAISLQRSENATALDSGVLSIRLFYNALGQALYTVGYHTEYFFIKLKRGFKDFISALKKLLIMGAHKSAAFCIKFGKILLSDFAEPYKRIKQSFKALKEEIDGEYAKPGYKAITAKWLRYAVVAVSSIFHLIVPLFGYVLPVSAAIVFIFVVKSFGEYRYGLNVTLEGTNLGIVENENVFEEAQALVRGRIRTVRDSDEWVASPEFNLTVSNQKKLLNYTQLADVMVEASGDKIQNAVGIIIDGELLGVTTDGDALTRTLESIKAPYQDPSNPNLTVEFVKNVSLIPGVYFTSSITEADSIVNTLTGQVSGEKLYTVVNGDSPSGIAAKVGIPLKDLYALNPQIDPDVTKKVSMFVGDELLISNAVDFLQVKTVERVIRQINIEHETVSTKSDQLSWGFQKITQAGEDGIEEREVDVTRIDGIPVSENIVSSRIIKEPVTEQVTVGIKLANGGIAGDASTGVMMWPVPSYTGVSRDYRSDRGLDITGYYGSPIVAADNGVVLSAGMGYGSFWSYGNYVTIQHSTGVVTLYAHMRNVAVSSGTYVKKGDIIGYIGLTGRTSGPHCHFETQVGGRTVDPYNYVKRG